MLELPTPPVRAGIFAPMPCLQGRSPVVFSLFDWTKTAGTRQTAAAAQIRDTVPNSLDHRRNPNTSPRTEPRPTAARISATHCALPYGQNASPVFAPAVTPETDIRAEND